MLVPPLSGIAQFICMSVLPAAFNTHNPAWQNVQQAGADRAFDLVQRDMQTMKRTAADLAKGVGSKEAVMNSFLKAQGEGSSEQQEP